MKWDTVIREGCTVKKPTECPAPPSIDLRCDDPIFRAKNPGLCKGFTRLIVKPDNIILCHLQTTTFKAFLITDGQQEVEITSGVTWQSSDLSVVQVAIKSGVGIGVGMGIATVAATYQDLEASAYVTVLPECCEDRTTGIVLVIDSSESMSQRFSALQGTKLAYAKKLAHDYAGNLNLHKDLVAVMGFTDGGYVVQDFTNDLPSIQTAIGGLSQSTESTDIADALKDAIDLLDSRSDIDTKVVILLTDGFQTSPPGTAGLNAATAVAAEFKSRAGFIVGLGIRSWGEGFDLLQLVSSAGFLLSAHRDTEPTIPNWLGGLSGYFCSGNCTPPGDVIVVGRGKLNYNNFVNWTAAGVHQRVDLIGGDPEHPEYDVYNIMPGNGLYVDLRGSPGDGGLRTRDLVSFVSGNSYTVALRLAGNQRKPDQIDYVKVRVLRGDGVTQEWEETVGPIGAADDFTTFEVAYLAADTFNGYIEILQVANLNAWIDCGALLDRVIINEEWLTTDSHVSTLLDDNFDGENGGLIPPECPNNLIVSPLNFSATLNAFGYAYDCYGYGCLLEPIPAQVPDPSPLPTLDEGEEGGGGGGGATESVTSFNPAGVFITAQAVYALIAQLQAQLDTQLGLYLPLAGGSMHGPLDMAGNTLSFGGLSGTFTVYQGTPYLKHPTLDQWHRLFPVVVEGSILLDIGQTGISIDFSDIPTGGGGGGGEPSEGPFVPVAGTTMEGGIDMNGHKLSFGGGNFVVYNGNPYIKAAGAFYRLSLVVFEGVILLEVAQTPTTIP